MNHRLIPLALAIVCACASTSRDRNASGPGTSPPGEAGATARAPGDRSPGASADGKRTPATRGTARPSFPAETPDFRGQGCFPKQPPKPFTAELATDAKRYPPRTPVRMTLKVTNDSGVPQTVEQITGQETDWSVDDASGEVWRWSNVAPLTAPNRYRRTWQPGESRTFDVVWDQRIGPSSYAAPGAYVVHGFVIADWRSGEWPGRFICFDDDRIDIG